MIFSKNETFEDIIIEQLLSKESSVREIHLFFQKKNISITVQGIYKILRHLISDEIVLKRKNIYSLSEEWKNKIITHFQEKENKVITLSENESIKLNLNSLVHLDQQWKNIVIPLQKQKKDFPVFLYNPHKFWLYLSPSRKESELNYYQSFQERKIFCFSLIGGDTLHDQKLKKNLKHDYLQINIDKNILPKTDYLIIIQDYIITTRLSKNISKEIEFLYTQSSDEENLEKEIQKLNIEKKKVKLIIERNHEKAKKIRKRLSKDFYISRELREKFDLF